MNHPQAPKKQTQNKPNSKLVLSAVEWANFRKAKMSLKSLARKSGHISKIKKNSGQSRKERLK